MTFETNPNTLDAEAIEYLGDNNKKLVMKMFDEKENRVMLFEMSVVNNDNIESSSNTQIGNNNSNSQ